MAVMEQETMPSTDDYQKAFLVFYPGETAREAFNAILRSAQDAASFLKLDGDQYDEFVRGQLHTTLDFFYKEKQAARAADEGSRTHEDQVTLEVMREHQRRHGDGAWASVRGGKYTDMYMNKPREL